MKMFLLFYDKGLYIVKALPAIFYAFADGAGPVSESVFSNKGAFFSLLLELFDLAFLQDVISESLNGQRCTWCQFGEDDA